MIKLSSKDIESVVNRLQGLPYKVHHWKPIISLGTYKYTAAFCYKCRTTEHSGKDFCDAEGLTEFWEELENRRDCTG